MRDDLRGSVMESELRAFNEEDPSGSIGHHIDPGISSGVVLDYLVHLEAHVGKEGAFGHGDGAEIQPHSGLQPREIAAAVVGQRAADAGVEVSHVS